MTKLLKGNFKPEKPVNIEEDKEDNLEDQFEREALKRLGGSIVFVSKKKVLWPEEEDNK